MEAVNLLLVGRDGNGKSSTGNSILRKKAFTVRNSSFQGSDDVFQDSAEVDGKLVTVVDGVSLRDGCTDGPENVRATITLAKKAVELFPTGFTALLVVLKYGVRFTNQEKKAINVIRSLFGDDALRKYGVVVMSGGDSFASDVEDNRTTFDDWCRQQTGDVKELFQECGNRYVLFNNRAKDNGTVKLQFQNLMSMVDKIKSSVPGYTIYCFKKAELVQRKLLVQSKLPQLEAITGKVLDSVSRRLRKLDENYSTPDYYLQELRDLQREIRNHKTYLQKEDEQTNSIGQLLLQISVTEASLSTKQQRYQVQKEYEENKPPSPSPPGVPRYVKIIAGLALLACIGYYFSCYLLRKKSPEHA